MRPSRASGRRSIMPRFSSLSTIPLTVECARLTAILIFEADSVLAHDNLHHGLLRHRKSSLGNLFFERPVQRTPDRAEIALHLLGFDDERRTCTCSRGLLSPHATELLESGPSRVSCRQGMNRRRPASSTAPPLES